MAVERYKNLIIGSGGGGKLLSWHLAPKGERTVVVERRWIGGSCPNINCLPSKNEIWSAKVADLVRHAAQFGVKTTLAGIDMAAVRQRKRKMVEGLVQMHVDRYKAAGVDLIMGEAKFVGAATVEVKLNDGGMRTLSGERVFLNVGTRATIPPARSGGVSADDEHRGARTRSTSRTSRGDRRRIRRAGVRPGVSPLRQPHDDHSARAAVA